MIPRTPRPLTRERLVRAEAYARRRTEQAYAAHPGRPFLVSPFWGLLHMTVGARLAGWDAGYRRELARLAAILGEPPP